LFHFYFSDFHKLIKNIKSILKQSYQGNIKEVVVIHKDQLCHFFVKHDTKVVIFSSNINVNDTESSELTKDLLLIVTIFTIRYNRFKLAKNQK